MRKLLLFFTVFFICSCSICLVACGESNKGDKGENGNGIEKIEKTSSSDNIDVYTIYLTDGSTYEFTVTNSDDRVECGRGDEIDHIHTYSLDWERDERFHWHKATCEHTDEIKQIRHYYDETNQCIICGQQGVGTAGLEFRITSNSEVEVVGIGSATDKDIVIPNYYNGLPVTSVGEKAFKNCNAIRSVVLGDNIEKIKENAFYDCKSLYRIKLGEKLKTIDKYAFMNCYKLLEIENNSNISIKAGEYNENYVGYYAKNVIKSKNETNFLVKNDYVFFNDNETYYLVCYIGTESNLELPENIEGKSYLIYKYAFYQGENGKNDYIFDLNYATPIVFDPIIYEPVVSIVEPIKIDDNIIYKPMLPIIEKPVIPDIEPIIKDESKIDYYKSVFSTKKSEMILENNTGLVLNSFNIIEEDLLINEEPNILTATKNCDAKPIESVILSNGVIGIGRYAFYGCSNLKNISISDSVEEIEANAFSNCENLKYNEYENALYIGNEKNDFLFLIKGINDSITNCNVNDKCKFICNDAFNGFKNLQTICLGQNVVKLGKNAFYGCYNLLEIINKSNINIGAGQFTDSYIGYYALKVYREQPTTNNFIEENDFIFYKNNDAYCLINYNGNKTDLKLPTEIHGNGYSIYHYAFYNNSNITSVQIPDCVSKIGKNAFWGCNKLKYIVLDDNVTNVNYGAFGYCNKLEKVYYMGNKIDWSYVNIQDSSSSLFSATICYYSENDQTEEGNYWHFVNGEIVEWSK